MGGNRWGSGGGFGGLGLKANVPGPASPMGPQEPGTFLN